MRRARLYDCTNGFEDAMSNARLLTETGLAEQVPGAAQFLRSLQPRGRGIADATVDAVHSHVERMDVAARPREAE